MKIQRMVMAWKCSRKKGSGSGEVYQKVGGGMGGGSRGVTTSKVPHWGRGKVLEIRVGDSSQLSRGARELQHLSLYPSVNS